MTREAYLQKLKVDISHGKSPLVIDEAGGHTKVLYDLLPELAFGGKKLDIALDVLFDNQKFRIIIPSGTKLTDYVSTKVGSNVGKLLDSFGGHLIDITEEENA